MHQQIQPRSADGFGAINSSAERSHSCSQWRRSEDEALAKRERSESPRGSKPSQPARPLHQNQQTSSRRNCSQNISRHSIQSSGRLQTAGTVGAVCTAQDQVGANNLTIGHILCSQYAFELVGAWVSTLVPLVSQVSIYASQAFLNATTCYEMCYP